MITRPQPFWRIIGSTSLVAWKAEERLIARIASHFSSGNSSIGATCWMPALFTMMSTRAEHVDGLADHAFDRLGLAHVGRRIDDLGVGALRQLRARLLDLQRLAEAVQHDVGARAREGFGDAEPDAAGRAGDDGGLAREACAISCCLVIAPCASRAGLLKCRVPTEFDSACASRRASSERDQLLRIGPSRRIDVGEGKDDPRVGRDHEHRRHRQAPGRVAVQARESRARARGECECGWARARRPARRCAQSRWPDR